MKVSNEQYTKWNKIHKENLMASSERVSRAFEYAKSLGVDEESNCEACGDVVTPDCECNHCLVCGYFKGGYLTPNNYHPEICFVIIKQSLCL